MIEVKCCPVCHSEKKEIYLKAKKSIMSSTISSESYSCTSFDHSFAFDILQCLDCQHIYSSFVPDTSSLSTFYQEVEDLVYLKEMEARRLTFNYYLNQVLKVTGVDGLKNKKVLEVGSYYGGFLATARDAGYDVMGIEPSLHASRYCQTNNFNVYSGLLQDWKHQDSSFDVIVFWDVFEHVTDPHTFLKKIELLLKSEGLIFFSTMDTKAWVPRIMGRHWPWFMTMHVNYYHRSTLKRVLEQNGFEMMRIYYHPHIVSLDYLFKKLETMYRPTRWIFKFLNRFAFIKRIKIPFNAFDNYLIVAKKK